MSITVNVEWFIFLRGNHKLKGCAHILVDIGIYLDLTLLLLLLLLLLFFLVLFFSPLLFRFPLLHSELSAYNKVQFLISKGRLYVAEAIYLITEPVLFENDDQCSRK